MRTLVDESGSPDELARMLAEMDAHSDVGCVLVLAAAGNGWKKEALDPILGGARKPVFGGIFPAVIHGDKRLETGTIVTGLDTAARPHVIPGLSNDAADYETLLETRIKENASLRTMLVLVDAMATRIGAFIEALYTVFGLEINYVGGGCGSLSFEKIHSLITPEGLVRDAALLVEMEAASGIGVAHGWTPVSEPYKATEVRPNAIRSLDWRPALDVYREVVEPSTNAPLTNDNFFEHAARFPLGIAKMDAEMVVRDPYLHDDEGALLVVGDVPEGAYMYVLNADDEALIEAAGKARSLAGHSLGDGSTSCLTLLMDCVSREMLLKDRFRQEMEVAGQGAKLVGTCCMGEIANTGREFLEFYNKTAVVALLEDV